MNPLLLQGLISAGSAGLGALANRFLNEDPTETVPDFTEGVSDAFARRRGLLNRRLQEQSQNVEDEIAAQGLTGTAAAQQRQAQIEAANEAAQRVNAQEQEALVNARNREKQQQAALERRQARNRRRAIGQLAGGLGQIGGAVAMNQFGGGFDLPSSQEILENAQTNLAQNVIRQAGLGLDQTGTSGIVQGEWNGVNINPFSLRSSLNLEGF